MSECHTKNRVEMALAQEGLTLVEESDSLSIYGTHHYPGHEFVLDWSRGSLTLEDIVEVLREDGIDPAAIISSLSKPEETA